MNTSNINSFFFYSKRINYTFNLSSSSIIPSLQHLPISIPLIPRLFLSFEWNVGRVNNQLYSFEAMIQYCVIYQRSLIIPFTTHRNHEIGILPSNQSLWDIYKFSELLDFIHEQELSLYSVPSMIQYLHDSSSTVDYQRNTFSIEMNEIDIKYYQYFHDIKQRRLPSYLNLFSPHIVNEPNYNLMELLHFRYVINNDRILSNKHFPKMQKCLSNGGIRDKISHHILDVCRNIHMYNGRVNHFKIDDWPIFNVMQFLVPSERIRNAVENSIVFWFEHKNNYRVGVHRRAMKEGGKDPKTKSPYVCRYNSKSLTISGRYSRLRNLIRTQINDEWDNKYATEVCFHSSEIFCVFVFFKEYKKEWNDLHTKERSKLKEKYIKDKVRYITDLYDRSCAINMSTIQQILRFHLKSELSATSFTDNRIIPYKKRIGKPERFWLACDNQEPEILEILMNTYGAITVGGKRLSNYWFGRTYWNKDKLMADWNERSGHTVELQYLLYLKLFVDARVLKAEHNMWVKRMSNKHEPRWWYSMSEIEFWRREVVIFDMWMLAQSQFFIGSWHSTLTRTVCHWRGYERMFEASNCYLKHKWAYTNEHKEIPVWFDINQVNEQLLSW